MLNTNWGIYGMFCLITGVTIWGVMLVLAKLLQIEYIYANEPLGIVIIFMLILVLLGIIGLFIDLSLDIRYTLKPCKKE